MFDDTPVLEGRQADFGLLKYTDHEIKNFSNGTTFFAETKQDIETFVKKYVHKKPYSRILCGKIDSKLAERIKADTGIDVLNYNVAITSEYENKHINPEQEAKQGMIAISPDIVALLPDIITNFDKVEYAGYNKQQQQVLRFEKDINGRKVAVEYVSKGRKTIDLQTMYGWEKKEKNSHQASHANAHDRTFKTDLDMSSSKFDDTPVLEGRQAITVYGTLFPLLFLDNLAPLSNTPSY